LAIGIQGSWGILISLSLLAFPRVGAFWCRCLPSCGRLIILAIRLRPGSICIVISLITAGLVVGAIGVGSPLVSVSPVILAVAIIATLAIFVLALVQYFIRSFSSK